MWREMPEQQLAYINQRNAELIAEAASSRSARRKIVHCESRFTGLHLHLGTLLIVIGHTLGDDELRHDAAHS